MIISAGCHYSVLDRYIYIHIEYFFTEFCGSLHLFRITRNPENNERNFKGLSPPPLMQGERSSKNDEH